MFTAYRFCHCLSGSLGIDSFSSLTLAKQSLLSESDQNHSINSTWHRDHRLRNHRDLRNLSLVPVRCSCQS